MQRQVYDVIQRRFRDYVKCRSAKFISKLFPFYLFLTGGGGVVEFHVPLKIIYMSITKHLINEGGNPENARIVVLAPSGVTAVHVSCTTVNSDLRNKCSE